eukprot:6214342-Pleurochrysis_carterae.AAC.5
MIPKTSGQGAGVGSGAKSTYGAALGRGARKRRRPCASAGIQSLGSGARALHKYTCDTTANWET